VGISGTLMSIWAFRRLVWFINNSLKRLAWFVNYSLSKTQDKVLSKCVFEILLLYPCCLLACVPECLFIKEVWLLRFRNELEWLAWSLWVMILLCGQWLPNTIVNIQMLCDCYLTLLSANGFGFKESGNTHWACGSSSHLYSHFSQVFDVAGRSRFAYTKLEYHLAWKGVMYAPIEVDLRVKRCNMMYP